MNIKKIDIALIKFFRRTSIPLARFGLFLIFFWFGLLKVVGLSPASDLVKQLFEVTIPWMSFPTFFILFGVFEMLIGILFVIRGLERIVIPLLFLHMIVVSMPLFLLPNTWTGFLVPTMEGQYIIKNIALIAVGVGLAAHLQPMKNLPFSK